MNAPALVTGASMALVSSPGTVWDDLTSALLSPYYVTVRRRIFRQLIESLLLEGIVSADRRTLPDGTIEFSIRSCRHSGEAIIYRCVGRISASFDRVRLNEEPIARIVATGEAEADSLRTFLLEIAPLLNTTEARLVSFIHEIEQTWLKDTLAKVRSGNLSAALDYDDLEAELMDGHPYHPCYKSRIGFDPLDNLAFGPEFKTSLRLVWLAIDKRIATISVCRDIDYASFIKAEVGEALHRRFEDRIREAGRRPDDYLMLPVHPWQWREKIAGEYFPLLRSRQLILLGTGDDDYRPQQSIRSLANVSRSQCANVKLPLSIVNTSADRILSSHNVENAAPVSDWLAALLTQDAFLQARLIFLKERVGITHHDTSLPGFWQAHQYGLLGAVWRENIAGYLAPDQAAVPFTALCHCTADGWPLIADWVERYGLPVWLSALLDVAVVPLIHLLYAHGIGMEAHAQNIVLIHEQGLPRRIALKDLPGGLRYTKRHLSRLELCPELKPTPSFRKQVNATAAMEVGRPDEVSDYLLDAFCFINLAEFAWFLQQRYQLAEQDFWALVAQAIRRYQAQFPQLQARFALFDLFAERTWVELLTKRRLYEETEARLHALPNPLHRFRSVKGPRG